MADEPVTEDEIKRLEEMWKLLSDEEAEELARNNETRYKRARLNPGAAVPDSEMGAVAYEVVKKIAVMILEDTIKIRTAGQARDVASIFHQIARLETGKSTANAELSREDRERAVRELAESAAERMEQREAGLRVVRDSG